MYNSSSQMQEKLKDLGLTIINSIFLSESMTEKIEAMIFRIH